MIFDLKKFVDAKFERIEEGFLSLQNAQIENHDNLEKHRTRVELMNGAVENRMNLIDRRLTTLEPNVQKLQDGMQEMKTYLAGADTQSLRQQLDKFAVDIEKAFFTANQVDLDLSNHIGTMGEAFGQPQTSINEVAQANGTLQGRSTGGSPGVAQPDQISSPGKMLPSFA